jgi:o-succinylbenzoate synthase
MNDAVLQGATTVSSPIVRVDTSITTTRLPRNLRVAHGNDLTLREHVIVRLMNANGMCGYGEASPLTFFTGETAESTQFAIDRYLGPLTTGREPGEISALHRLWDRKYPGYRAAKCALDAALHDLLARSAGLSVADLLGGSASKQLPIYKAIGFGTSDQVVQEAESLWDLEIRSIKLKIGDHPVQDLDNLKALRERFGDGLEIILDGNGGYTAQEAVRFLRKAEPFNVAYVEQPVHGLDVEGLAFVRAHGGVPVMADESVYTLRDVYQLIRCAAVDLLGIKLIKTAGLYPARQIVALAEEFGIRCVVISPFDTELGVATNAQLASTFHPSPAAHGLGSFLVAAGQQVGQLNMRSGELLVPLGPGLGVEPEAGLFEGGMPAM